MELWQERVQDDERTADQVEFMNDCSDINISGIVIKFNVL